MLWLSWRLVSKLIGAFPCLINLWSCSAEFLLFPGLWMAKQFSSHLQINCWSDWDQILWAYSLWASPGLINFWPCSSEFLHRNKPNITYLLHWIPIVFWLLISQAFSMHLQTNCWSDLAQIWWANPFGASSSLINFWSVILHGLPVISWLLIHWALSAHLQTTRWLDSAQIRWANSLWASPDLVKFWSCSTEFPSLISLWMVAHFPCNCR